MPFSFTSWWRNCRYDRRCKRLEQQQLPDPPMPSLPMGKARRPITATPCLPSATADSAFYRLPAEIRRRILIEAFGELAMHFDLRLLHPLKKPPPRRGSQRDPDIDDKLERDFSRPRQWQWSSGLCHNKNPFETDWPLSHGMDRCYTSVYRRCNDRQLHGMPPGRRIGAIGWILTCRQSYVEAIEVLYRTNQIRIHGTGLLQQLPNLMLPQHRVTIRSVELMWNIHPWRDKPKTNDVDEFQPGSDMKGFVSLLNAVPTIFPNLTVLWLYLGGDLYSFCKPNGGPDDVGQRILDKSEILLQPVDMMATRLQHLSDFNLLLPSSYFRAQKLTKNGVEFLPRVSELSEEPVWRDLSGPNKWHQDERAGYACKGYWIHPRDPEWLDPNTYIFFTPPCF